MGANGCFNSHCVGRAAKGGRLRTHYFRRLILSFRRVLYVMCFLLGNSPAPEF